MDSASRVVYVNVGRPRPFELDGRQFTSAIWKSPVEGRIGVRAEALAGDGQADLSVHGGPDKAVYAYAEEDYRWWESRLNRTLAPGTFGENLTVAGLELNDAVIGERWKVGTALFEVSQPRMPCFKLGARMGDKEFPRRFSEAARWGTYLRVLSEGDVGAGDGIVVVERPAHGVTVRLIGRAYHEDRSLASSLLAAPQLPVGWRRWALKTSSLQV